MSSEIIAAIDLETTGLAPHFHDIIEIAILPLDGEFERDLVAGQSPVFGVGWSMGGSVLLESVARRPRLFAGLLVVAASPRMMKDDSWKGMSEMRLAALRLPPARRLPCCARRGVPPRRL